MALTPHTGHGSLATFPPLHSHAETQSPFPLLPWEVLSLGLSLDPVLPPTFWLTGPSGPSPRWIKALNEGPETIKLLEENTGRTFSYINHNRTLYDPPPRVMEIKTKINQWDRIKLKSFCTTRETIRKVKDSHQNWRK